MQGINNQIKKTNKKVVFADGEDENTLKAAIAFKNSGLGTPILVAKEKVVKEKLREIGYGENFDIQIVNSTFSDKRKKYVNYLFKKLQRTEGLLERDCDKMVRKTELYGVLAWLHVVMLMQWLLEIREGMDNLLRK